MLFNEKGWILLSQLTIGRGFIPVVCWNIHVYSLKISKMNIRRKKIRCDGKSSYINVKEKFLSENVLKYI